MKVLVMCEYPPAPAGLATQGELLVRGLREIGVEVQAVHYEAAHEKEWYYRWFQPDLALGIGYWGYAPHLIQHPQRFGVQPVPWLVANGYIARYREELNALPLILLTSDWVRQVYIRDGIRPDNLRVLPVGCDVETFTPELAAHPRTALLREQLGVKPDQLLLLTVGGDAASKGAREVMRALARVDGQVPDWRYVCKVWPQPRTTQQTQADLALAEELGIREKMIVASSFASRNFMPYLMAACDLYVGPSRLEGFGMPHVEAGACGKPVIAMNAMAFRDTLVHGETALLAGVARENVVMEVRIFESEHDVTGTLVPLKPPRVADYRASVDDLEAALLLLMNDAALRRRMGEAGRRRVTARFAHRVVAEQMVALVAERLPRAVPATAEVHTRLAA
jgi:starch synthase